MITQLTEDQKTRFPEFIKKWTDIGLCTDPANRKEAEKGVQQAYKMAGLDIPKKIIWCGSPLSQRLARSLILGMKDSEAKIEESVRNSVGNSVCNSVWKSVGDSVCNSVLDSVVKSVGDSVWDSVWKSVGDSVWDSVGNSAGEEGGVEVWDSLYGQHHSHWLGFYDYFKIVCGLEKETMKLCGLWKIAENAGGCLPYKNICWISERHNILNRNSRGQIHCENGPAIAYPDGWEIYSLNGVKLKKYYVVTPAEKISPQKVLSETNVEIRRELLRKIGIERFLSVAKHKILGKVGDYELLSIERHPETPWATYLKMVNPSIGTFHIERVSKECKTVQAAINWRASKMQCVQKGIDWEPSILT